MMLAVLEQYFRQKSYDPRLELRDVIIDHSIGRVILFYGDKLCVHDKGYVIYIEITEDNVLRAMLTWARSFNGLIRVPLDDPYAFAKVDEFMSSAVPNLFNTITRCFL